MKKGLALFDFDGTITSKDSLLEFIKFSVGKLKFLMVMGLFSPFIFYYVFLIKKGETAKMMVLSFLFKNKTEEQMISMGLEFAQKVIPRIVLPKAINKINELKNAVIDWLSYLLLLIFGSSLGQMRWVLNYLAHKWNLKEESLQADLLHQIASAMRKLIESKLI